KDARRYQLIVEEIEKRAPVTIMEIGTWNGLRGTEMIHAAQRVRSDTSIVYFGFDLFEDLTPAEIARDSVREHSKLPPAMETVRSSLEKTGATIHLTKGNTIEVLPPLAESLPVMDFVYIDGGHSLATIASDWNCVLKRM